MILENRWGRAEIEPQGAQVLSYVPSGGQDLLWVSPRAVRRLGTPLRGGIPLCAPWFSNRYPDKPMHGFCRTKLWQTEGPQNLHEGTTRIVYWLEDDADTQALWPTAFRFEHEIVLGSNLTLTFRAWNRGRQPVSFEMVWHTYFAVASVDQVKVTGLDGCRYLDKNAARAPGVQQGDLFIGGPIDRIFPAVPGVQTIHDQGRQIRLTSSSKAAVVWNAGDGDRLVEDLGPGTHQNYLCVERGDLDSAEVILAPEEPYQISLTIQG